jgi:hypothetical protein
MSIDLIREKQRQILAAKEAAKKAAEERSKAAKKAFDETGIPAMWAAIKDIKVPHWRGNGSRENNPLVEIPLSEHVKSINDVSIWLLDHDGGIKISWYAESTDKGALWLRVGGREGRTGDSYTAESLRDHFVDYMAKLLPPLENTNAKV